VWLRQCHRIKELAAGDVDFGNKGIRQDIFSKSRTLFWRSIIHSINTFPEYLPQARHHHSYRYSGYILKTKERKALALRELAFLVWRDSKLASENCNMSDDAEIVKV